MTVTFRVGRHARVLSQPEGTWWEDLTGRVMALEKIDHVRQTAELYDVTTPTCAPLPVLPFDCIEPVE